MRRFADALAIDVGFAETKWAALDARGYRQGFFTSAVSVGSSGRDLSGLEPLGAYETQEQIFTVGPAQSALLDTRTHDFRSSPIHRVLVAHAVAEAGLARMPIELALGLPTAEFYDAPKEMLVADTLNHLGPQVVHLRSRQPVLGPVENLVVLPQAGAAFLDMSYDKAGNRTEFAANRAAGVIDFGGYTTDLVEGRFGDSFSVKKSLHIGASHVIEEAGALAGRHLRLRRPDLPSLTAILKDPIIEIHGKPFDMAPYIAMACPTVALRINNFIQSAIGPAAHLSKVVFCGGAVKLFEKHIPGYPNRLLPDDPAYLNVRGLLKRLIVRRRSDER